MKNAKNGFTLTELLITIAIMGVLAAIVLPRYFQVEAGRTTEATTLLAMIRLSEEDFKDKNGCYATVDLASNNGVCGTATLPVIIFDTLGAAPPANSFFTYTVTADSVDASTFCVVATRNSNGPPPDEFLNKAICLDETGAYFGNHPNSPSIGTAPASSGCNGVLGC